MISSGQSQDPGQEIWEQNARGILGNHELGTQTKEPNHKLGVQLRQEV